MHRVYTISHELLLLLHLHLLLIVNIVIICGRCGNAKLLINFLPFELYFMEALAHIPKLEVRTVLRVSVLLAGVIAEVDTLIVY